MLSDVVGVIQTALAPVFLLAGTAAFLSVYTARLTRVADRVNTVEQKYEQVPNGSLPSSQDLRHFGYLQRRTLALEVAVILATFSGFCTCISILALLGGAIGRELSEATLFWFFSGAIASLLLSFVAFLFEIVSACLSMMAQMYRLGRY
ncbi:DUF2721 domain-containing protein [Shinella pollutisoli]|uniref:DUF2721 domain-containing protein n=1 Tax=Shinella pollutisoli TaxID=2250594 RepID=A0ABV7DJL3_9HYPH|nr:DUF2721 domain-containing protein [Shinella pollutisoli]